MNDPMNKRGSWPAVKPVDVIEVDFVRQCRRPAEGSMPDTVNCIRFDVFCVAVFLAGVIIAAIGVSVVKGVLRWREGLVYALGFLAGFAFRLIMEQRKSGGL